MHHMAALLLKSCLSSTRMVVSMPVVVVDYQAVRQMPLLPTTAVVWHACCVMFLDYDRSSVSGNLVMWQLGIVH